MKPEQVSRTFEIAEYCARTYGDKPVFYKKKGKKWQATTCNEYYRISERLALGLITAGVKKGDYIATVFNLNLPQWNCLDMALSQIGVVHIPIYPTISDSDYLYILNQAEVKYVFTGDQYAFNRISVIQKEVPSLQQVFTNDKLISTNNYDEIKKLGENCPLEIIQELERRKRLIKPDDVVSIIYTSGNTGFPKGVMLSHKNLVSNMFAAAEIQPLGLGNRVFSFLPLCHVYERTANYQFQIKGAGIFYCESMKNLMNNFQEIRPHGTSVVPRVLEKIIRHVILSGRKSNFIVRWSIYRAVSIGFKYKPYRKYGVLNRVRYRLAYMAVFRHVRASMGGRVRYIGCGGAPINDKVERFFWACRLPVYQGYGLTEASPLVSLNYPGKGNYWIGSVGPVIKEVKVKIAADGEILVKGPNIMKGYFKQEDLSEEAKLNGWLHTGDTGRLIRGRFLQITGRKKHMFKTSYGKYIVPQAIESKFADSSIISHIMVIGEGKHCAGAVICPNFKYIRKTYSITEKINRQKLIELPIVKKVIQEEVNKVNRQLGKTEQIKKHLIVSDVWTAESGELSPALKIKRNIILKKYNRKIHLLYKSDSI